MSRLRCTIALAIGVLAWGATDTGLARERGASKRRRSPAPRTAAADDGARSRAARALQGDAACADLVQRELSEGRKLEPKCDEARRRGGRAAVRATMRFGYVERRDIELRRIRLVLGRATTCRRWPLRAETGSVLRRDDVTQAGCGTRRARDSVAVTLISAGGDEVAAAALEPDSDGAVTLSFAQLDLQLRALGYGTLDDYARIELGEGAWAGSVDLEQLRGFRAQWHLAWVRQGRGVPGLFAARYPDHPGAPEARALDAAASVERQRRAAEHVRDGHLTPRRFLERYPDSPFRTQVEAQAAVTPARGEKPAEECAPPEARPAAARAADPGPEATASSASSAE